MGRSPCYGRLDWSESVAKVRSLRQASQFVQEYPHLCVRSAHSTNIVTTCDSPQDHLLACFPFHGLHQLSAICSCVTCPHDSNNFRPRPDTNSLKTLSSRDVIATAIIFYPFSTRRISLSSSSSKLIIRVIDQICMIQRSIPTAIFKLGFKL